MRNWKYILRLIGILSSGIILVIMTYQFKDSVFVFEIIAFGIITIIGFIFLIWSLLTDLKNYRIKHRIFYLFPIAAGLVFTLIIGVESWQINVNFDKPTLLKIHHDGDFYSCIIDFKSDGTFIFENSALGFSDYEYGTYNINADRITLSKSNLDNVIKTNHLEIRLKTSEYPKQKGFDKYIYQLNDKGEVIEHGQEFRVVIDNRNE